MATVDERLDALEERFDRIEAALLALLTDDEVQEVTRGLYERRLSPSAPRSVPPGPPSR